MNDLSETDNQKSLKAIAKFKIHPDKMDEFKKIAASCIETVKLKDKGTLEYDWFYNETKSECVVCENYKDSNAVLEHSANVGELLGKLLEISTISLEVYGNPSEELKMALEGLEITFYKFNSGL